MSNVIQSPLVDNPFADIERLKLEEMETILDEARVIRSSLNQSQLSIASEVMSKISEVFSEGLPPRDTEAPPPLQTHGWLEQYAVFASEQLADLETLVLTGLTEEENDQLINIAAKLMSLAELKDPSAMNKLMEKCLST